MQYWSNDCKPETSSVNINTLLIPVVQRRIYF